MSQDALEMGTFTEKSQYPCNDQQPMLRTIAFDVTRGCNCRCVYCRNTSVSWPNSDENLAAISCFFHHFREIGVSNIFLTGGEFFTHPSYAEILRYASDEGLNVFVITNGIRLAELDCTSISRQLNGLCVSIHASTSDLYAKIMGIDDGNILHNICQSLGRLSSEGTPITLFFSPLPYNVHELERTVNLLLSYGVDITRVNVNRILPITPNAKGSDLPCLRDEQVVALIEQAKRIRARYRIVVQFEGYPLCYLAGILGLQREDPSLWEMVAPCEFGFTALALDINGYPKLCPCTETTVSDEPVTDLMGVWTANSSILLKRSGEWLPVECTVCPVIDKCRGGCPFAFDGRSINGDPLLHKMVNQVKSVASR